MKIFQTVSIFALLALCLSANAAPGLYHQPERDGHGLLITQDMGEGSAVIWYLYQRDGSSAFLIAGPCEDFPCVTALYRPTASWMGGQLDLGEPVGSIELHPTDTGLRASFDLRGFDPENCTGISAGGVLFRECAGNIDFELLAR